MVKKLILTADDFGSSLAVNEAIEEAHRNGVLSTASLMVGAKAAGDAIDRACRLRSLRVGLHLVLVDGSPVSPPHTIPSLVNPRGEFSSHLFRAGINFYFRAGVRQQLEREIRAQFQAFRDTGLVLDHVNCHKHMHLHPTIGRLLLKVGREYGLRAVRYPYEPVFPSWRASRKDLGQKLLSRLFLLPWLLLLKKQLRQARVSSNNFVFGMNDSGNMHLDLVLRFFQHLPSGVTEIYFHPALHRSPELDRTIANYHCEEEFATLTSSTLEHVLRDSDIQPVVFSDL
ncbi:MAG TPA: hopanoid biosynthesis-associated protein HpnK [Syntrophales bacterium]|nr:hopanoid biosynthesis-associated protein HpnK [Syntrophales bacterium]